MTLFKQIALVISSIIVVMIGSIMYINYNEAKINMIDGLYETTVNNIATLSDKLAEAGNDEVYLETIIDSEFDNAYYKLIEYKLNNSSFSYKQVDKDPVEGVPSWFVENTDIELKSITVDVSSGWEIFGELTVEGDTNIIYKSLYKMFVKLLYLFVIFVSVTLLILNVLLHFVLKPLKKIQAQAEAILNNEFIIQKDEPYTTEFKEVVKGMNAMVKKVEDIFENASEAARRNSELLYRDPLTKLFNRRYLMLKLPEIIQLENRINGGSAIFISLNSIEHLVQKKGEQSAQKLLREFTKTLQDVTINSEESIVARLNEREFVLILSAKTVDETLPLIKKIDDEFVSLLEQEKIDREMLLINFGVCSYKTTTSKEALLTRVDSALVTAIAQEKSNFYLYKDERETTLFGKTQWRELIQTAIEGENFYLKFYEALYSQTGDVAHKVLTFTIRTEENKEYYFGDFIAPAINFELVSQIYIVVLKKLLNNSYTEIEGTTCSIRLSNEFLKDKESLLQLTYLFKTYAKNLKFQLTFELSNNFVIKNRELVKEFVQLLYKYNFGFGINSFSSESNDLSYLKELNPLFIKMDGDFLLDQPLESINALQVISNSLGILIIATSVRKKEDISTLSDKNIIIIQGPATELL